MENIRRKNNMIETYSILLIDMVCVSVSYYLSLFIRFHLIAQEAYPRDYHSMIGAYILILCLMYTLFLDGNRWFFERSNIRELYYTIRYTGIIVVGLVLILYLTQQAYEFSRLVYLIFAIINTVITFIAHIVYRRYMLDYYRKSVNSTKMFVLTREITAKDVLETLQQEKAWDYDITAAAVYDIDMVGAKIAGIPVVASMENVYDVVCQMMVDEVFLSLPGVEPAEIREMVHRFEEMGLVCHYRVDLFSKANPNTYVQQLAGYSVISFSLQSQDSRRLLVKRLMDIIGSLIGCVLTLLITPFVALAIKIDSPGPVFFSQTRIGKNGRRFKIWKFRSMYTDAEARKKELEAQNEIKGLMFKMEDDPRITKVGKFIRKYVQTEEEEKKGWTQKNDPRVTKVGGFLRKTSLDEFPQLFNVLKGDMSLVGTRPPTEDEFEQYNGYYRRRMSITPGLTGMWQVSGRSDIQDFEEIVKLDLEYIDNWSLLLDIKILFKTVFIVLGRKGSK